MTRVTTYAGNEASVLRQLGFRPGYIAYFKPPDKLQVQIFADTIGKTMDLKNRDGEDIMHIRIKRMRVIEDHPLVSHYLVHNRWIKQPEQISMIIRGLIVEAEAYGYNPHGGDLQAFDSPAPVLLLVRCADTNYMDGQPSHLSHNEMKHYGDVLSIELQLPSIITTGPLPRLVR